MVEYWSFTLTVLIGFFAILNPVSLLPIFVGLTEGATKQEQKKAAFVSTFTAFIIVAVFVLLGKYIFEMFGITIPAFKITGGVILFHIGFEILQSKKSSIQNSKNTDFDENIAISPLAIPIIAGPGTIVTAMNLVPDTGIMHIFIILFCLALFLFVNYMFFLSGSTIIRIIGSNKIAVITKIMGLIIAIIGTSMIIEGIKLAFNL